jgi:hypothetical protein
MIGQSLADHFGKNNQNTENVSKRKKTVPVRANLPKGLHKKVKKYWANMPRDQRFENAIIDVLQKGVKALRL